MENRQPTSWYNRSGVSASANFWIRVLRLGFGWTIGCIYLCWKGKGKFGTQVQLSISSNTADSGYRYRWILVLKFGDWGFGWNKMYWPMFGWKIASWLRPITAGSGYRQPIQGYRWILKFELWDYGLGGILSHMVKYLDQCLDEKSPIDFIEYRLFRVSVSANFRVWIEFGFWVE